MSVAEVHSSTGAAPVPFHGLPSSDEPLADVVARVRHAGADGEFRIEPDVIPPAVRCGACGRRHLPHRLRVLDAFRFGGPSSAGESFVIEVECPRCAARGTLVAVAGPAASAEEAEVLRGLAASYARTAGLVRSGEPGAP